MQTVRDIIERAYEQSKVKGTGMNMTGEELRIGVNILNLINDEVWMQNIPVSIKTKSFTFNGSQTLTIGTEDIDSVSPDILVNSIPDKIVQTTIITGNSRYIAYPISSDVYFARGTDSDNTTTPNAFYYEPSAYDEEFSKLNYIGSPSGTGELVYVPSTQNLTANSSTADLPRGLIPYLTAELAFRIGDENGNTSMITKGIANNAWNLFVRSTTKPSTNDLDRSAFTNGAMNDNANNVKYISRGY